MPNADSHLTPQQEREARNNARPSMDKLHELQLHAVRQIQALAKADGFKRLPDEKAFMDDVSGESDFIIRNRFTMLTDPELMFAREWWAGLSEGEKVRRRERAVEVRASFGIDLPEADDDERA